MRSFIKVDIHILNKYISTIKIYKRKIVWTAIIYDQN